MSQRRRPPASPPSDSASRIEWLAVAGLTAAARNARTHSNKQLKQIAASIERFGFTNPVLVDEADQIIAGHGRVAAAKLLGMETVPCLRIATMSAAEKRAYVLADNKLALNAGWDEEILAQELKGLLAEDIGFDIGLTGFSIPEIDSSSRDSALRSPARQRTTCCPPTLRLAAARATCGSLGPIAWCAATASIRRSWPC